MKLAKKEAARLAKEKRMQEFRDVENAKSEV